ncbi:hypothetical protein PTR36_15255 [Serratia bockelmannii]|uniref:hypothetical protein n=1 Tax=Serratia bockelmannii TaxID=2703793 RepID=UPI00313D5264
MAGKINGSIKSNGDEVYNESPESVGEEKEANGIDDKEENKNDSDDRTLIKGGDREGKKRPKFTNVLFYMCTMYFGVILIVTPILGINIPVFITKYYSSIIGVLVFSIGAYNAKEFLMRPKRKTEVKFTDVDEKYNKNSLSGSLNAVRASTSVVGNNIVSNVTLLDRNIVNHTKVKPSTRNRREEDTFITYFKSMKVLLERKASAADEKASILLEKGTSYTKFGIIFYLTSILIWQYIFWKQGFKVDFAWGIASCSFLFLFIEFLSAWFLKQYKNFTDTSTYLIKVKSTLDRYMLMYMLGVENKDNEVKLMVRKSLLDMLSKEIQWPDNKTINNNDNGYAKDALSSLSGAIKSMSEGVYTNKKEGEKK